MDVKILISIATASILFSACGGGGEESNPYQRGEGSHLYDNGENQQAHEAQQSQETHANYENHANQANFTTHNSPQISGKFINVSEGNFKQWDKLTISDSIGKIEDKADFDILKPYGLKQIGNDLVTAERVSKITGKNGTILASSKYHNALSVLNFQSGLFKYRKFAAFDINYASSNVDINVPSQGGGASSSPVVIPPSDSSSHGSPRALNAVVNYQASNVKKVYVEDESCLSRDLRNKQNKTEHVLLDAKINSSVNTVYALVAPVNQEPFSKGASYGLFKTYIGQCGVNPYDAKSTLQVDSTGLNFIKLSADESKILSYKSGVDSGIIIYNTSDLSVNNSKRIADIKKLDYTKDQNIIAYQKGNEFDGRNLILFSNDLTQIKSIKIDFDIDYLFSCVDGFVTVSKNTKIIRKFNSSLNEISNYQVNFDISHASVNQNGKALALSGIGQSNEIAIFALENTALQKPFFLQAKGEKVIALGFSDNETLAYTPDSYPNSVQTLNLNFDATSMASGVVSSSSSSNTQSIPEVVHEELIKFGDFSALNELSSVEIPTKASILSNHGDRLAFYNYLAEHSKGLNIYDISGAQLTNKASDISLDDRKIAGLGFLDKNKLLLVNFDINYPARSMAYFQDLNDDGSLKRGSNTKINPTYLSDRRDLEDVQISRNAQHFYTIGKHFTTKEYYVDKYDYEGLGYQKKSYKQAHMTGFKNSLAIDLTGINFVSIGSGKLYKNGDEKNIDVPNASSVFYVGSLIIVGTDQGKFYSFDENLENKKAYEFEDKIIFASSANDDLAIFTNKGIYTFKIENHELKASKKVDLKHISKGFVNDNKIFALTNSPKIPQLPVTSSIKYFNF